MKAILTYLNREPCKSCTIDESGKLQHCDSCNELFSSAVSEANELAKMPTWQQKQKLSAQKAIDVQEMKMTHVWMQVQTNPSGDRGRMMPFAHCRKCGLSAVTFRAAPSKCPKYVG